MCGITGIYHYDTSRDVDPAVLKKMTDSLVHRGPDGEGYYIKNNIGLGHRRLSIIDLQTGDQPMYSGDGNIALIFNGEIYNYIELREELKKSGYVFHTTSDTEVIIISYRHWGVECLTKFNGCWAFALWDESKKQLFLSRDRIGEKPLYYSVLENTFVFGSEIKSLLAFGIARQPALELTGLYLTFGYIPAPYSFVKNIYKLKPGHYIIVDDKGFVEKQYWDLPLFDEDNMQTKKNLVYEEFEYLLRDSVKIRMRSDVPFGAFLSGGLDSSSIVALMSELSDFPVETFTIGFAEKSFDERSLAKEVAIKFRTNHHEKIVQQDTFDEALAKVLYYYDEPFGDSSAIPSGYVAKFAREKVKMVLTGDGGDEVLSGYNAYLGLKITSRYRKIPGFIRREIPFVLDMAIKPLTGNIRYKLNRLRNVCNTGNMDFEKRMIEKMAWTKYDDVKAIYSSLPNEQIHPEEFLSGLMKNCPYKDEFYRMMYEHFKLSLPDDMLVKVDRMTMANSLEARIPFLDHRLIEFMVKVHKDVKLPGSERKSILKNTVGKKLPASLLRASKKGFVVPVREWFKDKNFENKLAKLYQDPSGLNNGLIKNIIDDNRNGVTDNGNFIWMLFVLKNWFAA